MTNEVKNKPCRLKKRLHRLNSFLSQLWLPNRFLFSGSSTQKNFDRNRIGCPNRADDHLVDLVTHFGDRVVMRVKCDNREFERPSTGKFGILFFYGMEGCLAWYSDLLEKFHQTGGIVGVPDYVGYGASNGFPTERSCYETADAAYDYFVRDLKIAPEKMVIVGHSLGSAVAVDLAARRKIGRLIVCSGFTSLSEVASIHYPRILVRTFMRYRFNSAEKIADVDAPILFLHGVRDRIVPKEMSERNREIAQKAGKETSLVYLAKHGHELFEGSSWDTYKAIDRFIRGDEKIPALVSSISTPSIPSSSLPTASIPSLSPSVASPITPPVVVSLERCGVTSEPIAAPLCSSRRAEQVG